MYGRSGGLPRCVVRVLQKKALVDEAPRWVMRYMKYVRSAAHVLRFMKYGRSGGRATNTFVAKESSLSMKREMGRGYRKTRMWCDYLTLRCGGMRAAGELGGPRRGGASLCHWNAGLRNSRIMKDMHSFYCRLSARALTEGM